VGFAVRHVHNRSGGEHAVRRDSRLGADRTRARRHACRFRSTVVNDPGPRVDAADRCYSPCRDVERPIAAPPALSARQAFALFAAPPSPRQKEEVNLGTERKGEKQTHREGPKVAVSAAKNDKSKRIKTKGGYWTAPTGARSRGSDRKHPTPPQNTHCTTPPNEYQTQTSTPTSRRIPLVRRPMVSALRRAIDAVNRVALAEREIQAPCCARAPSFRPLERVPRTVRRPWRRNGFAGAGIVSMMAVSDQAVPADAVGCRCPYEQRAAR